MICMYAVEKFVYNGVFVNTKPGYTKYTAVFKEWTADPGIARCACSDGKERLIPSCCLVGFKSKEYPAQDTSHAKKVAAATMVYIGQPSKS